MNDLHRRYRALGDPLRLRLVRLLARTPLNVSELVSLVGAAQSSVSHHLAKLKAVGLVREERQAGFTYCSLALTEGDPLWPLVKLAADQTDDAEGDLARLADLLRQREDREALNERLLEPGQSWMLWSAALGKLLPPLDVAELGCGTGSVAIELARWARSVVGIDESEGRLAAAKARAARAGLRNIEFRQADVHGLGLKETFDLVFLSQSLHYMDEPAQVLKQAHQSLRKGGRLLLLEILPHREAWVRERLGHKWLGFAVDELEGLLRSAGFRNPQAEVPTQPSASPFRVFLAMGER